MAVLKYKKDGVWYKLGAATTGTSIPESTEEQAGQILMVSPSGEPMWGEIIDVEEEEF